MPHPSKNTSPQTKLCAPLEGLMPGLLDPMQLFTFDRLEVLKAPKPLTVNTGPDPNTMLRI